MGAADIAIFDDDDASDWGYDLEETDDLSLIIESLTIVVEAEDDEYLESTVCVRALAAAAVLAGFLQGTSEGLPEGVQAWLADHAQSARKRT